VPSSADRHAFAQVTQAAADGVAALPDPIVATLADPLDAIGADVSKGIAAYLATVTDPSARYTGQEYKSTLRYLKPAFALIAKLASQIAAALTEAAPGVIDLATQHLDDQIGVVAANSDHTASVSPAVQKSLAKQYRTNAATSMAGLADEIRATLAAGVVNRETIEQLVARLSAGDQLGVADWARSIAGHAVRIARGIHSRASAWVDRVVGTEVVDSYGQAFNDALEQAARAIPDIKRRWDARMDACPVCTALDRQVRAVGEQFDASDTGTETLRSASAEAAAAGKYDAPPAHPNCRCFLTVFRPGWSQDA
jgi:hypothetical protein